MQDIEKMLSSIKILYVEDEDITRIIAKKLLKKVAGKLFIGKNGQEGLELFKEHKPEIIVTDLRMPVLDGIEMIKQIRDFDQECGIIISTEIEDIDYILRSVDIGIDKYLVKPVEKEEIFKSLEQVMEKVIKRKSSKNKLGEILKLSKKEKLKIQDEIKSKIGTLIKNSTGKGPQNINVFLSGSLIEVKAYGVLTPMEKILLKNPSNIILVEYYRKLFYKELSKKLESLTTSVTRVKCVIDKININILANKEQVIFKLQFNNLC